jgi:hypothetical protein
MSANVLARANLQVDGCKTYDQIENVRDGIAKPAARVKIMKI